MADPKITWYVRRADAAQDDDEYQEKNDFYAGTYTQETDFAVEFMIWNNRYGKTNVGDLKDFTITVTFDTVEDTALFSYCSFLVNGITLIDPVIEDGVAQIKVPESLVLSGEMNDGEDYNGDNYMLFKVTLSVPKDAKIKMNDLKTMSLGIETL